MRKLIWCVKRCALTSFFLLIAAAAVTQSVPSELFNGLKWRLIGPFRGGRAVAVAGVPGDPTTFYFGSVNGGIWKTTDAGVVWTPIFGGHPVASIGALAAATSNPKIIYAGTGESDIREDLSSGDGVYKSIDGGSTWNHIGLQDTRQISRIVIDPRNPDVVYVGALGHAYAPNPERGVYKSVDGGMHWTKVLDLGPEIGISDLAMSSASPQLLFAGAWHVRRAPWSEYAPIEGSGSGLYRSQDAGKTWSRLNANGLPEGDWGRVGVEVAADGKRVYALIEAKQNETNKPDDKRSGLYRSDDGGNTWSLANADPRLTGRAWYFNRVTVDPQNPDVLYIPNVSLYRSEDGGKTMSVLRGAPGGDDYHQLWIDPKISTSMILGSDQGTSISLNRGETWSSWYNQPTAQFYHVTTDNRFPYVVYGAEQDSGAAAVPSRTDHGSITPRDWFLPGGSESGYLVIDRSDPNIIYLTDTYGSVFRFNRRTEFSQIITPWPATGFDDEIHQRKYRDPWTPVLVSSPAEPAVLYLGTQYVMKTVDGGLHWQAISGDLTGALAEPRDEVEKKSSTPPTLEQAEKSGYGVVFTIAPSPIDKDLIWVGSDTGLIHITRDGGKNWKNVTPHGLSDWSKISLIEASHFAAGVAYAAVDRARLDDRTPYIYRTRDYGSTWELIANGIQTPAFLRAVREDPQIRGLLFAATEFGVYVSFDDGDHWQSLQLNLPVTGVRDLAIHGDDLVAATFGRSFWILDDITPLRQVMNASATILTMTTTMTKSAGGPLLYQPATAVRIDNDWFPGTPLPPEEPTAENPPDGAIIDYFLPATAKRVQLEILDQQKKIVRTFSSEDIIAKHRPVPVAERWFPKPEVLEKTPGMHRFVWDLAWGSSGGPSVDEDTESNDPSGPKIAPGIYQVRLTVDGKMQDQSLKVIMDPRSSATTQSLQQQFEIGQQIFGEITEAKHAIAEIKSVQKQLDEIQLKIQHTAEAPNAQPKSSLLIGISEVQSAIENILTNKKHTPEARPGLQLAQENLASALRVVKSGDQAVPSQAIAVYHEASPEAKERIAEWERFKQMKLPSLNQQLRQAEMPAIDTKLSVLQ